MTPKSVFQLSSHSFEFLLIQFLNYDFSVSNFAAGILFAAMEHYREQPMSFLCTDRETGLDRLKAIDVLKFCFTFFEVISLHTLIVHVESITLVTRRLNR